MTRSIAFAAAMVLAAAGTARAQQGVVQSAPVQAPRQVVVQEPVQTAPAVRSYRSYSVRPSAATMGDVSGRHSGEATWRHATAKAAGHYHGGR